MKSLSKQTYPQKPIIVVVGPTASGKSDLAVFLAKKFNGEVISADSRQVYKGMNIGTGKITQKEMSGIPHYLLDVASPSRRFTAGQYKKLGQAAIKKIQRKNKIPIICGGTGFYIRMLIDDLQVPAVKPDLKLRAKLEKKTTEELFAELKKLDPRRAKEIDRHNPRRLVRALEIIYTTGKPVPPLNPPQPSLKGGSQISSPPLGGVRGDFNPLFFGISIPRPKLAKRIKIRLEKRLKQGMLAEVKKLRKQGVSWKRLDSFGLEYRWLAKYLQKKIEPRAQAQNFSHGKIILHGLRAGRNPAPKANSHSSKNKWPSGAGPAYQEMIARLQKDIEHYAKRQMTWFKRDSRIHWIKNSAQAEKITVDFLKKSAP